MSPPSLQEDHVAATRGAILGAARASFGDRGYAATSIDDVAAAARVTKGAVYHHFSSKRDLFRAVYLVVEREAQARAAGRSGRAASTIDAIARSASAYLDAVLDPETQRITLVDAPSVLGGEQEQLDGEDPGHAQLREVLAAARRRGEVVALDPDATAHLIRGSCLQAALYIARSEDPPAARRRVGPALDRMIRGIASPAREA